MENITFLGLPLKTLIIVGGLFLISALSPTIVAIILNLRKESKNE